MIARLSLSLRIALAAAVTISAALASYGLVSLRQQQRVLLDLATRDTVAAAADAAESAAHHLLIGDYAAVEELLLRLARNRHVDRITIAGPDGAPLAEVRTEPGAIPTVTAVPEAIRPPARPELTVETSPGGVVVWHPITGWKLLGWVRFADRLEALAAAERATVRSALALAAAWSAAATILLVVLLRRPVVSIRRLAEFARGLGTHKGEAVTVPSSSPEIVQLAAALDEASRELREGEARLLAERELLQVTLRSITDGVVAADREGRIVLANDARRGSPGVRPGVPSAGASRTCSRRPRRVPARRPREIRWRACSRRGGRVTWASSGPRPARMGASAGSP